MMSTEITREMIFDYFASNTTTLQKRRVEEWAKDPQNRELFYEYLAEWESQNIQYVSDVETAITRHEMRQHTFQSVLDSKVGLVSSVSTHFLKYLVAATVVMGILMGGYFSKDRILYKSIATAYGQTQSVLLNDGTRVILNSNSVLTVPRFGFGNYTREVAIKGEANFSVTHLPSNQKFIVKTIDGPDVVVLGTEFLVYSRLHGTKVILSRGKIQLNYEENKISKNLIMHPGELVTIDTQGKAELRKTADPELFSAWKDHRYVFEKTSLLELCTLFEENFGLNVEIVDHEIATWTVSGAFLASNAEELLEALAESAGLVYKKDNQKVIIHSVNNPAKLNK